MVAAGGAVRAEADGNARSTLFDRGSEAARQHHVAGRIVHAAHLPLRQDLAVGLVDPDTMRREHVGPENSEFFEVLHWRGAIFLAAIVQLFLRLPNMNQYGGVVL